MINVEEVIEETWKQECQWHGRKLGKWLSKKDIKRFAQYTEESNCPTVEYFIRAQFLVEQKHKLSIPGPIKFSHLTGRAAEDCYCHYMEIEEEQARTKCIIAAKLIYDFANAPVDKMLRRPSEPLAAYCTAVMLGGEENIPPEVAAAAAIELVHWPKIRNGLQAWPMFTKDPEKLIPLYKMYDLLKMQVYGSGWLKLEDSHREWIKQQRKTANLIH